MLHRRNFLDTPLTQMRRIHSEMRVARISLTLAFQRDPVTCAAFYLVTIRRDWNFIRKKANARVYDLMRYRCLITSPAKAERTNGLLIANTEMHFGQLRLFTRNFGELYR